MIDFVLHGLQGQVSVTVERNERPELVGSSPESRGFPVARAAIDYPDRGYDSMMGWIQLVRSDDNRSGGERFEIDPLAFLGDLPHPFCWLGINPTLFDAPSRSPRRDLDWMAESYLCIPEGDGADAMEVHALLGFTWGFTIRTEQIAIVQPARLEPIAWNAHTEGLAEAFPSWRFPPGFRAA